MAGLVSNSRDFRDDEGGEATVLVEFAGHTESPVTLGVDNRMQRLINDCNVRLLATSEAPQPGAALSEGSATTFSAGPSGGRRRFLEVASQDKRTPIEVATAIEAALGDEAVTILPVPFAVPAIAPAKKEPASLVSHSPDFHALQGYAGAAPAGLGFSEVGSLPGADGAGVTVIDLEGGWLLGHEALRQVRYNLWSGSSSSKDGWIQHGTAVSSMLIAPRDGIGISGLVPAARAALASIFAGTPARQLIAQQIDSCRILLTSGDVLLVEVQRPGPATDFQDDAEQRGYLPTSFWPDVRESIRACVAAGITVVEVAGNGGVDLGDPTLQGAFDQKGSSLTALASGDSGGIVVGAGRAPLPNQIARSRCDFSNYGDRLDCQAWGEAVVAAGYGDLWGGPGSTSSYTSHFLGTSSAGPLVTAAVVAIQGRHRNKFGKPIPPLVLRQVLASMGAGQPSGDQGRIGPQPNLPEIFAALNLL